MREVLQDYAIDPARIALLGVSGGGTMALQLGLANGDVFSRVILFSGFAPFSVEHEFDKIARHGKPPMFVGMNSGEATQLGMPAFVERIRHEGYAVTDTFDTRGHMSKSRESAGLNWLFKSWQ